MTAQMTGLRIGLVGSCQVVGMGAALQKLCPGAEVETWHIGPKCPDNTQAIAARLATSDLAISQVRTADPRGPLEIAQLRAANPRAVYVPVIAFNGFHPDCIYIKVDNTLVAGPLQFLHSGIIAGAYALGLPQQRAARLFNAWTYASLGYFEAFGIARDLLVRNFAACGFDLEQHLAQSMAASGAFMHTINHPHIALLALLAHSVGVRAGLVAEGTAVPEDVEDFLSYSLQWPIYPEIARGLALPKGDMAIRMPARVTVKGPQHRRELVDLIAGFYEAYGRYEKAAVRAALPERVVLGLEEVLAG